MTQTETTGTRVLIVDDEQSVARTLGRLVKAVGHQVRTTCEPAEFLRLHEQWQPSHVIVDLAMPGIDGLELLQQMADRGSKSAVIISSGVSARVLDAAARVAADSGLRVAGVVPKPFRMDALRRLLDVVPADLAVQPPEGTSVRLQPPVRAADENDLRAALAGEPGAGRIRVVFQPKVSLSTGVVSGFEALARWAHPELGSVPSPAFIELAEQHGLIDDLTQHVLDGALSWMKQLPHDVTMSVNISGLSVGDPTFAERKRACCQRHGVSAASVIFELTETSATQDPVAVLRNLTKLRLSGFALSLDDFGTGYSSMSQLAALPFSEIKIDRSFVASAVASEESRALVRSVIELGRDLDLVTVAEGVEDQPTFDLMAAMGCDLVQGYFVSRPLEPAAAMVWLDEHASVAPASASRGHERRVAAGATGSVTG